MQREKKMEAVPIPRYRCMYKETKEQRDDESEEEVLRMEVVAFYSFITRELALDKKPRRWPPSHLFSPAENEDSRSRQHRERGRERN